MHPIIYEGVKFYSNRDLSLGSALEKAEPVIVAFTEDREYKSINEVLELYNVQEVMAVGILLPKWTTETYERLKSKSKTFTPIIAKFFSQICDDNFIGFVQNVAVEYIDDFWLLFARFKVYQRLATNKFEEYLRLPNTVLYKILEHKDIVKVYDEPLTKALRESDQTCGILVRQFLEKNDVKYYLPLSFKHEEFDSIFQKYISAEQVNPNVLKLIFGANSTSACPISDETKLSAKRRYNEFWKTSKENATRVEYGIRISFTEQKELKELAHDGLDWMISYDIKWLEENLDYPTILNNFIYVFEMFDNCGRSKLVSVSSQINAIENVFTANGVGFYQGGNHFRIGAITSSMQMTMYYDFLKSHDINLEDVFVWFFTTYLKDEFGTEDFYMKATSATDYDEKCRTLASGMDGILKQYRMHVKNGGIDRELFEMSSEQMVIGDVPSQIKEKYAYANSNVIQQELHMMFSDQTGLSYTERTKSKHPTLFELLKNETMFMEDFAAHQVTSLNWLIKRKTIILNEEGKLILNSGRVRLLKDLYDHEVICVQYLGKWATELKEMYNAGDIRIESTLFSIPEKNYLNYILNKAEYSNGLDLRNKYIHGTYSQDESTQKNDYMELLKIMVLIVTKINEEFCLRDIVREVPA